jgi:DNA-binding response OmpR family regulator
VNRFRELSGELGLVLLDLTMPQMNGVETCKQLREISPGVQVLLMSGFDEAEAVSRFSGQGLAGFVQKPFEMEDLRAKLRSVLDKGKPTTS